MSRPQIEPQTLKGFRDFLPTQALARERLMEIARSVYRSYGFSPIDTPALEYAEVLTGKGGRNRTNRCSAFATRGTAMWPCGSI